ncbi:condensin complex subunit 1-like isoform X1 [Rhopilema esculentum]|uniref:condensin complex subunit 1-like isoform X1 n=1 Tax=Rhopilema esculentum TaxID=499914 RepID=UPI0031CDB886
MDYQIQNMHLNTTKMLSYLLTQLMEAFEGEATTPSIHTDETRKGRGKSAKKKVQSDGWSWENEREFGLRVIGQLLELDVHRLWDPPVIEEDYVNLFTSVCYKFLENVSVVKLKETKEMIFHILGILIKKYDHGLSASLKIIQLLQHFTHLVTPLAQAVETFVVEFGAKRIVADIIREIGRMDSTDLSRDVSGTRSFSQFVVELADRQASLVLPNISLLLSHLDGDSYSMRNGVLGVIGEIVVKVLSKEGLDANLKNTREKFLDRLEEHLHDVHAFVRSKVLQIWHTLCTERAIPLSRLGRLMDLVIGRLHDKSSQVRKYAVQLLKAVLCGNPFSAKLSSEELQSKLDKEREKLKTLIDEVSPEQDKWAKVAPNILEALNESVSVDEISDFDLDEDTSIEEAIENILTTFYKKIEDGKGREAVAIYKLAETKFPEHFCADDTNENAENHNAESSENDESANKKKLEIEKKIKLFEAIYRKFDEVKQLEEDAEGTNDESDNESSELKKQRLLVKYLEDSLRFATQMQKAIKILCQLLGSKFNSDILETVDFFVSANEFGLTDVKAGTRKMLALIWSRDSAVREAVINAYRKLYIESRNDAHSKSTALSIVQNIAALTYDATLGELTSLEELLKELYKMELIPQSVLQLLWQRFSLKIPQTTPMESRSSVLLLGMFAGAEKSIVSSNIDILVSNGLGPRAHEDFPLAFNTCTALLKLTVKDKKINNADKEPFRFPQDHEIFEKLELILVKGLQRTDVSSWSSLALQAVNVIYQLAEHPDIICAKLIKNLIRALVVEHQVSKPSNEADDESSTPQENGSPEADSLSTPETGTCQPKVLARVLTVIGQVAFQQLGHMDVNILSELKRRHRIEEQEKEMKQAEKGKRRRNRSSVNETVKETTATEEGLEDELGVGGAAAEDAETEFIRNVCEKDIVTGTNLLAVFGSLLISVCSNPVKFADEELRTSACLALSKFMIVSSEFCEPNLQLLFTILEKSKEPIIRANTIIALGDLTFRFPNLIEPWTAHLYGRLADESVKVRQTTVTVLTHLILNDMVKVKGQISEMAFRLEDEEKRIADLAKLFFTEFSQKGNALYNVLPDIISRLSDPDSNTDEKKFQRIMEYLLQFIQKDKQSEALIEKLCHRFRVTSTTRQRRDLAFCVAQLPFNEKCFKKLQENFSCFQEALSDQQVFEYFASIISKSKKFIKQDFKVTLEEFEQKVINYHNKAVDDEAGFERAAKASHKAELRKNKQKNKPGDNKRKGKQVDDFDDDQEKENFNFKTPKKTRTKAGLKSTGRTKKSRKPIRFSDDDDDDDADLFEAV